MKLFPSHKQVRSAPDMALEIDELRTRLAEAEETLRAIRNGEVDALLIGDGSEERIYTLRSADASYRALVEQMHEGAVTLSHDDDITYCNRAFARMVNASTQQILGSSIGQFIDAADYHNLRTLIKSGEGVLRTRLTQRGSPTIDARISVSGVTVDDVEYPTLIVTDLSTLTQVQRESRSKDEFLAMLAHELRNPLGAIGGAAQVLGLLDLRDDNALRARAIIQRQVRQMARLLDDLLDVGRVVTGKIALDRRPVDLAESLRSVLGALSSSQRVEERIMLTTEPACVEADPVRLEQIVGNLVSNALKFSAGLVRVSLRVEGAYAVVRVADEGVGIDPRLQPHIFDLFVQGTAPTPDRKQGGLGIGLTLVRRLAELHGGSVEVSSEGSGKGSTFAVRLPLAPITATVVADRPPAKPRAARRVLLVDDNADAREMYSVALQSDGHTIYQAEDAEQALVLFSSEKPEVAVVDIGLPGMDGYELARRIRSSAAGQGKITLIALTGYGFPEDRERSRAAGFDLHLVKPVAPEDLRQALDGAVGSGPRSA